MLLLGQYKKCDTCFTDGDGAPRHVPSFAANTASGATTVQLDGSKVVNRSFAFSTVPGKQTVPRAEANMYSDMRPERTQHASMT
jgi:hypothetical protein